MKGFFKLVGMLTMTCTLCGLSLAYVYDATKIKIEEVQKKRIEDSIKQILPGAQTITPRHTDAIDYYVVLDAAGATYYVLRGEGSGYQGTISLIAVLDAPMKNVVGIEIIESQETPGLGSRINDAFFKEQFKNMDVSAALSCVKAKVSGGGSQVQAITGATVSSRAVVSILNSYIEKLRKAAL